MKACICVTIMLCTTQSHDSSSWKSMTLSTFTLELSFSCLLLATAPPPLSRVEVSTACLPSMLGDRPSPCNTVLFLLKYIWASAWKLMICSSDSCSSNQFCLTSGIEHILMVFKSERILASVSCSALIVLQAPFRSFKGCVSAEIEAVLHCGDESSDV